MAFEHKWWGVSLWGLLLAGVAAAAPDPRLARDPTQPLNTWYGAQIAKYTTDPVFNTVLTDYLPASDSVPDPSKVLGDVAGAPDYLPYVADVHRYFRLLADATPRVRVFPIGKSEEGREMIAVAIADAGVLAQLDAHLAELAQLADPRLLKLDDSKAEPLIRSARPVYYITAALHSNETGSPTAVMELAYRLAVDEAPYIREIRSQLITLITPVVETDGRDRAVDIYNWHKANPGKQFPPILYWGHYVAHDNNRDAMGLTLNLSRNVLDTFVRFKALVLHDLHESVPFLYDNTVGDGPYNAWVDPILVNEWQQIGWDNVQELTRLGLPGVYTHGNFDTWSPGYLMFFAAMHNGISRLYETFGNAGADTLERQLDPEEYARTWYRPNPPWPKVQWSQRNNNNYTQAGLLTALSHFARNREQYVRNFWLKSKRSVQKPLVGGPAAYVLPADSPTLPAQAALLKVLRAQHVELHRTTRPMAVPLPADREGKVGQRNFPAGSIVVRMDQPYSRIADTLLDRQYWAPDDPQKNPYDDTAWSLPDLYNTEAVRVTDPVVLEQPMTAWTEAVVEVPRGDRWLIRSGGASTQIRLAYALTGATMQVAGKAFKYGREQFGAGTLLVDGVPADVLRTALHDAGLRASPAPARLPAQAGWTPVRVPRIAVMHTWWSTQTEGWWRLALDRAGVRYSYISTQDVAVIGGDLRSQFDVILFGPADAGSTALILDGLPRYGNAMPWQQSALTPNLGVPDSTADIRPGLGAAGLDALKSFVDSGGLLITSGDTAQFAIDTGLAPGVRMHDGSAARVVGTILRGQRVGAETHPVLYDYAESFPVYSPDGAHFSLSWLAGSRRSYTQADDVKRPTGRGGPDEIDQPQDRPGIVPPKLADPEPWEAQELTAEELRNNPFVIPPGQRPQALVRFGDADGLLLGGLLAEAGKIARKAIVVQARRGQGSVLLFAINPLWRGQTVGNYGLVFNAILGWDRLGK